MKAMKAVEITPNEARCGLALGCPSVFKTNRGTIIVIGTVPANDALPRNVRRKMGRGEVAIEITADILPQK